MGIYVKTLRKGKPVQTDFGPAYRLAYLCRAGDDDPGNFGYAGCRDRWEAQAHRRAVMLDNQKQAALDRWGDEPVYVIECDDDEEPSKGDRVYFCPNAHAVAVWYDCDKLPGEEAGRLKEQVRGLHTPHGRKGRKLSWTIMTFEEARRFDAEERACVEAEQAECRRQRAEAKAEAARQAQQAREAAFRSEVPRAFGMEDGGHPKYRENVGRQYLHPEFGMVYVCETECCSFCGKPVNTPRFYGYHYYGSTYHQTPTENGEEEPIDALGFYPIGSDCAKRLLGLVPVYDASFKRLNPEVEAPRVDSMAMEGV